MLIKNGMVINPATGQSCIADILIKNGVIQDIADNIAPSENEKVIDAYGLTIAPGLIDTHVHFRDTGFTHKETLHTGSLTGATGGFISEICYANNSSVEVNIAEV